MKFSSGQIVATPGAIEALSASGQDAGFFVRRHLNGDWGQVCEDDRHANEVAVEQGERILSAYKTLRGVKLWIITEWDRSVTTLLLPDEY